MAPDKTWRRPINIFRRDCNRKKKHKSSSEKQDIGDLQQISLQEVPGNKQALQPEGATRAVDSEITH